MRIAPYIKPSKFTKDGILNYLKIHKIRLDYEHLLSDFVLSKGKIKIKKLVNKEDYVTNNFAEFKRYCKTLNDPTTGEWR